MLFSLLIGKLLMLKPVLVKLKFSPQFVFRVLRLDPAFHHGPAIMNANLNTIQCVQFQETKVHIKQQQAPLQINVTWKVTNVKAKLVNK